jgi:type II secretory pathway component GspD/PulD (secretin)
MNRLHVILALSLLLCAADKEAKEELVYRSYVMEDPLPAAELVHLRRLVGKNGRVFTDAESGRLMVIAATNIHQQVAIRIAKATSAERNVRIDVIIRRIGAEHDSVTKVTPSGKLIFRPAAPNATHRIQGKLTLPNPGTDLKRQTSTDSSVTRQSITVLDNREATLFIGTEVVFLDWLMDVAIAQELVPPTFTMRNVGSRLVITPKISKSGDIITLELTPELSGLVGFGRERIRFTGVSTVVKVRNGATFHIGGAAKAKEFYDKFLVGVNKNGRREMTDITVTPRILNARGQAVER